MITRKSNIFESIYTLGIFSVILIVIYYLQYLRPSGDDYCFGANVAEFGILGGVVHWWKTWSGFIFSMFGGNLFVGFPLAYLSFDVASAIPFIVASFGMGLVFTYIQNIKNGNLFFIIFLIGNVAFLWWVYLWATPLINNKISSGVFLSNGLTFWQTLNGQYVIVMQIFILFFCYLIYLKSKNKLSINYYLLSLITSFFAGTTGTTLSLAFLVVCFYKLTAQMIKLRSKNELKIYGLSRLGDNKFWFLIFLGVLIGIFVSHLLSPGSQIRVEHISPNYSLDINRIIKITTNVIYDGLRVWLKAYLNYGAIIVVLLFVGIFIQIRKKYQFQVREGNLAIALYLAIFALLQCFINRLSEEFTYNGYWHYVSPIVCVFLSLLFLGVYLSKYIVLISNSYKKYLFYVVFLLALFLGISSCFLMINTINYRYSLWIAGPAPLDGISDISANKNSWEDKCWEKLNNLRHGSIIRGN